MDLEKENEGKQITLDADKIGDIRFEEVYFRYGSRVTVFEELNLTISKGKVTAFVGESGSGKSTLDNIIQKLYPLQKGRVTEQGTHQELLEKQGDYYKLWKKQLPSLNGQPLTELMEYS